MGARRLVGSWRAQIWQKRVKALRDGAFGTYAIQTLKNFGWGCEAR